MQVNVCFRVVTGLSAFDRFVSKADIPSRGDPLVAIVGKLAIAHQIGVEEDKSKLRRLDREPHIFDLSALSETWLVPFAHILTTDVRGSEADAIFENLEVISFNYDRSFEAFLPTIFHSAYGFRPDRAQALSSSLNVFHPYGSLGPLPWQATDPSAVEYGAASDGRVETIATSLRTFTERNHDASQLQLMHRLVGQARQLVFIGFGFHRQNMTLLRPDFDLEVERIFGTVYAEPTPAVGGIQRELTRLCAAGPTKRPAIPTELAPCTSQQFMSQYYSPLTA